VPFLTEPGLWLDHTFLVRLDPDQLQTQLIQALGRWDARPLEQDSGGLSFCISTAPTWWTLVRRRAEVLRVRLEVRPARLGRDPAFALRVHIYPDTAGPPAPDVLEEVGLAFLRALRDQLGAAADLRRYPRWECRRPVRVLPVYDGLNFLHAVDCTAKDVSAKGIGLLAPGWFPAAHIGLHLPWLPGFDDTAVRAAVVRCTPRSDGLFDVGAVFE
jgi:hypothetical protein